MKKRIIALLLTFWMLGTSAVTAEAAVTDLSPAGAVIDAGLVAADYDAVGSALEPAAPLPGAYSSLEQGYLTPVRSQIYNTCWAYSSTAVMEALLNKNGSSSGHLSTMSMNYWATTGDNGAGWQRTYRDAGYPYIALGYLTSIGAVEDEALTEDTSYEDYLPVRDSLKPCAYADAVIYLSGDDADTVKTAVYEYGAAVGNFHFESSMLNNSTSAYYCDTETIATSSLYGHAVAIVGWDDAYSTENFAENHRPENDGAWLCKNSWGADWGTLNGYFWISYEDKHLFDSRFGPSYAIAGATLASPRIRMQQDEVYGATFEFDYIKNIDITVSTITYANVMDFSDEFNVIDKVIFESTSEGARYDVYYIPTDDSGLPVPDEALWTLLSSGTIDYQGYICAEIGGFAAPLRKGAIGVQLTRTESTDAITIGVDEWLSTSSKMIFTPESERGMSYLLGYTDEAIDVMDFYLDTEDDPIGGTFVIKALSHTDRVHGDADGNGRVTIIDATFIQRYLVSLEHFSDVQLVVADYDHNGKVTILDATRIQRMLAGLI